MYKHYILKKPMNYVSRVIISSGIQREIEQVTGSVHSRDNEVTICLKTMDGNSWDALTFARNTQDMW